MRQVNSKRNCLLLHDDGTVHYPCSLFLTNKYDNPNTRDQVGKSLRILYRFFSAHEIELAVRAAEGRCLTYIECQKLADLCYRPSGEVESLSNKKVVLISSTKTGKAPKDRPNAVEPNTAQKRLFDIAKYLLFYLEVILEPNILSRTLRESLRYEYGKTAHELKNKIGGTKQGHHHNIISLPSEKFLEIIRVIYLHPKKVFLNDSGEPCRNLHRDRAMALLACECLRPGTIGNIARSNFRSDSRHLVIVDNRNKRTKTTSSTPFLKLGASTLVNSASEGMIELWPFTVDAVNDYIESERTTILSKHLKNRSAGFLFLNEKGEPIKHRASLTDIFHRLGKRLVELGLLKVGNDPFIKDQKQYDFYAYVLRHSAACFFLKVNGTDNSTLDKLKIRFGWTLNSKQPQRYAARVLSDKACIDLMAFYEQLIREVKARKEGEQD